MWQLVGGYRGMGEVIARHIEQKLKLPQSFLDQSSDAKPTTELPLIPKVGSPKVYPVVPVVTLAPYSAKPIDMIVMPIHGYPEKAKVQAALIDAEDVIELSKSDTIFFDCNDVKPRPRQLYVVSVKGAKNAVVLLSRKSGTFGGTGDAKSVEYPARQVDVIGRVILTLKNYALV